MVEVNQLGIVELPRKKPLAALTRQPVTFLRWVGLCSAIHNQSELMTLLPGEQLLVCCH
jgi:hypothetical protein